MASMNIISVIQYPRKILIVLSLYIKCVALGSFFFWIVDRFAYLLFQFYGDNVLLTYNTAFAIWLGLFIILKCIKSSNWLSLKLSILMAMYLILWVSLREVLFSLVSYAASVQNYLFKNEPWVLAGEIIVFLTLFCFTVDANFKIKEHFMLVFIPVFISLLFWISMEYNWINFINYYDYY